MTNELYRWAFDNSGNNYLAWMYMAETLLKAAKRVRKGAADDGGERLHESGLMLDTYGVYAMLLGYTIECLLKGIWVKNGNVLARNGSLEPVLHAGDHQLAQLAKAVGETLSRKEEDVLERLSAFVLFAGRYPIPTRWERSVPRRALGRGKIAPRFFAKDDFAIAELLENRFRTELFPRFPVWR